MHRHSLSDRQAWITVAVVQWLAVGRFLNHSAQPNVFMQCVFTGVCAGQEGKYDERMPTLAFFASCVTRRIFRDMQ
jgi:hypothetical protein